MKRPGIILAVVLLLSSCLWQGQPNWEKIPGKECKLVTHRLALPQTAESGTQQGKIVALRESEARQLRDYLLRFTESGMLTEDRFAPKTVLIGSEFELNFQHKQVILRLGSGTGKQYVRLRTAEDDAMLQLLRKRSDSRQLKK